MKQVTVDTRIETRRPSSPCRTVGDVMTTGVVSAHEDAPFKEIVDADGVVIGIVSRADLCKVFLRDDKAIGQEVAALIREPEMALDPLSIHLSVTEGVVTLRGRTDTSRLAARLAERVGRVSGVVDVLNGLNLSHDGEGR